MRHERHTRFVVQTYLYYHPPGSASLLEALRTTIAQGVQWRKQRESSNSRQHAHHLNNARARLVFEDC